MGQASADIRREEINLCLSSLREGQNLMIRILAKHNLQEGSEGAFIQTSPSHPTDSKVVGSGETSFAKGGTQVDLMSHSPM